jgi:hypothetical protein
MYQPVYYRKNVQEDDLVTSDPTSSQVVSIRLVEICPSASPCLLLVGLLCLIGLWTEARDMQAMQE